MISDSHSEIPNATDALLRLVLTHAPTPFAIFDAEMRYLLYTRQWVNHLPIAEGSLSGRTHREVLPEILVAWEDGHRRALQGESTTCDSEFFYASDGTKQYLSWEAHPWRGADGSIAGSLVTYQDITRQVRAESKLRCEMESAAATNLAKARLLESNGYEVRSAMNSIVGMAHLCLRSTTGEKERRQLETIVAEAKDLTSSFNDILDLSKVETGTLQLENNEFRLGEVLGDLARQVGIRAEEKGVEFLYQLPSTPLPSLVGDAGRLKQVLAKLCENALNLTDRGEVELSIEVVSHDAQGVVLGFSVRDTSPTLTVGEREALMASFEEEEQPSSAALAKRRLGLSVCRKLVALMDGQLGVESAPRQGNIFTFQARFPIQPEAKAEGETPPNALMGARVLVVDDHSLARKTMARLLKSFDFEVGVAESGTEAIEMTKEACKKGLPYQFVFMDYLMPGMNGLETTARLKESVKTDNPPKVILMTGRPMDDKQKELEDSPLDGYISKPFTPALIFFAMLDAATAWPASDVAQKLESENAKHRSLREARILLVEDDPINQEIVSEILGDAGVKVDIANHGREGLACLERRSYDAILMDVQMPVMDGYEATCRIRDDERFADLPIIALTASAMTLDRHACLEIGMNAHVAKPINPDELLSVVAEWAADRETRSSESAADGSLSPVSDPFPGGVVPESPSPRATVTDPFPGGDSLGGTVTAPTTAVAAEPHASPSSAPAPRHFDSLDVTEGVKLMGGNEKLFRRILQKFVENQAATDREIRAALAMGDHQTALRLVHTLKGLAGNIAASRLAERMEELESALKEGRAEEAEELLSRASADLQQVVREITARLEEPAGDEVSSSTSANSW